MQKEDLRIRPLLNIILSKYKTQSEGEEMTTPVGTASVVDRSSARVGEGSLRRLTQVLLLKHRQVTFTCR